MTDSKTADSGYNKLQNTKVPLHTHWLQSALSRNYSNGDQRGEI